MGQTENTFWNFPTFAYCENHNRRHSCLLHKIPRENLYSSWRCYKNHKQQSDMCMIKRKPWQTRVFHQILHFFLFFSRHNMYLGTRYSLSQRRQNHYDVVYSPRVNIGDFNVKKLKVWKILWICKGMRIYKRHQKYFESIVPVKQSIFAAVLFTWHNHYHFVILFVF